MSYRPFLIALPILALTACGGGSGSDNSDSGNPSPDGGFSANGNINSSAATVDQSNIEELGTATTLGLSQAVKSEDASQRIPFAGSSNTANGISLSRIQELASTPVAFVQTDPCPGGGSYTVDFPGVSDSSQAFPENGTITFDFNNCKFIESDSDDAMSGKVTVEYKGHSESNEALASEYTVTFTNLSFAGFTMNGKTVCTNNGEDCSEIEEFSVEGVAYRVEDAEVEVEYSNQTYTINARVYDQEEGYIDVSATDITVNDEGYVCSGSAAVSDATNEAVISIDYPDCSTFTVTYEGTTYTFNQ